MEGRKKGNLMSGRKKKGNLMSGRRKRGNLMSGRKKKGHFLRFCSTRNNFGDFHLCASH
ncbi:hypothetical protein Hdeb2414_s0901g00959331 [Helianthus debilis subsp. tardiflorus]